MNGKWERLSIQDVAVGVYDGPHATPRPSESGPIYLGIGNITEDGHLDLSNVRHIAEEEFAQWTRRVTPQPGDIVFTYEATLNRYAIIPEGFRGCLGRRTALIRPDPRKIDTRFLFYSFFGKRWRDTIEEKRLSGATVDRIPIATFPQFPIDVPSLPAQRRIASILGAYDELIEVNRRRIALLEEMARRLFEEWFVRFRFPGREDHALVETPNGPLPNGWKRGILGDMVSLSYGRALKADVRVKGSVPVIGSSGVVGWHNEALVRGPGIVVGRKGNVGSIIWSHDDFYPIDTVFFVETDCPKVFVLHQLRRFRFLNSDAAVPGLNRNAALSLSLTIPPIELMTSYEQHAAPMLDAVERFRRSNSLLAESRNLLLPRLLSGDLSISTAERELEAVA